MNHAIKYLESVSILTQLFCVVYKTTNSAFSVRFPYSIRPETRKNSYRRVAQPNYVRFACKVNQAKG